jgi:hypothetical protein
VADSDGVAFLRSDVERFCGEIADLAPAILGDEARVVLVEPDAEQFRAVIGRRSVSSLLDPARRAPAARAGRRHGLEVASQVAAVWND